MKKVFALVVCLVMLVSSCLAEEILNAENCEEFGEILLMQNPIDEPIRQFVTDNAGKTIEFDGFIVKVETSFPHQENYDIMFNAGDFEDTTGNNTAFRFHDASLEELGFSDSELPSFVSDNQNVHVVGVINEYDLSNICIDLEPVSIQPREIAEDAELASEDGESIDVSAYIALEKGSKGDEVKVLQQRLIDLYYLNDKADGSYGNKTKAAVEKFQRSVGLEVTGIADPLTQARLFADDAPQATMSVSRASIIIGSMAKTTWNVEGQEFTLTGSQTKKISTAWGTYRFDAFGNYEKVD